MAPGLRQARVADVFSLLSEGWRLRLLVAGKLCICDLAALTGMSESAVSHALRRLRAHRVVLANRRGRMAFYRLDDAPCAWCWTSG